MSIESVIPSNHLILCHPHLLLLSIFPGIGSFPENQLLASGGQSIGVSASALVLPMSIQGWFSSGWTGWIFFLSREISRAFPHTTVQKYQFFWAHFLYTPTLTSIPDYWKNHSFDQMDICWQSMSLLFNMLSRLVIAFLPSYDFQAMAAVTIFSDFGVWEPPSSVKSLRFYPTYWLTKEGDQNMWP